MGYLNSVSSGSRHFGLQMEDFVVTAQCTAFVSSYWQTDMTLFNPHKKLHKETMVYGSELLFFLEFYVLMQDAHTPNTAATVTNERPVKSGHGTNHLRPVSPFLPSSFSYLSCPLSPSLSVPPFPTPSLYPRHQPL